MMRFANKLLLLALTLLATTSFAAPTALAQPVEVENETNGGHCQPIALAAGHAVTGGCVFHLTGQMYLTQHTGMGEVVFSNCFVEFTARVNEDGQAYIYNQAMAGGEGAVCNLEPCDESEVGLTPHANLRWAAVLFEGQTEAMLYTEGMAISFCVRTGTTEGGTPVHCTITADMLQDGHMQFLKAFDYDNPTAEGESCWENPAVEVSGLWVTEGTLGPGEHAIGVVHTGD